MSQPPDIEAALEALAKEMGDYKVRRTSGSLQPRFRWHKLYDWCKAHPGVEVTLETVPSNVPYRLRKRYPDLLVQGSNHRNEDNGPRVATMIAMYEAPDA